MINVRRIAIGMLVLQIYVHGAPSDISKLEDIAKVELEGPKLDSETSALNNEIKSVINSTQGQRQKRFYNFYGYGFPPVGPTDYPSYNKRDQSADTGIYGAEDPLTLIHRRLQEIANVVRQPIPPPPQLPPSIPFPLFFPVVFLPQPGCACKTETNKTPQTPSVDKNETVPDVTNRFPVLDDVRQNWGFITNEQESNDDGEEYSRPISFEPIAPDTPISRPAPPVEHGSSQADSQGNSQTTTTVRPNPQYDVEQSAPYPPSAGSSRPNDGVPSTCDKAILSCCHQPIVTYDCFTLQGCTDPTSIGNPCDPKVILRVIERFQKFYGQRNG